MGIEKVGTCIFIDLLDIVFFAKRCLSKRNMIRTSLKQGSLCTLGRGSHSTTFEPYGDANCPKTLGNGHVKGGGGRGRHHRGVRFIFFI